MRALLLQASGGIAAALMLPAAASAATCQVSPQEVNFGSYDPIGGLVIDGIGAVNVSCDAPVNFTVSLTAGSGTFAERRMTSGAAQLGYNLYTNSSRTVVWADGITGSGVSSSGTDVYLTIYGRIAGGQNVPAGTYIDTLVITVIY